MVFELYIDKAVIFFLNFTLLIYFSRFSLIWTIFKHFIKFVTVSLVLCSGPLAVRHVGSQLPDQGLTSHPLHWKAQS